MLQFNVDRPMVDQTGIKGRVRLHDEVDGGRGECGRPSTDAPPGLFTAIQEQIGLKLEPTKATGGCAGGGCGGAADGELATQRVSERE